MVTSALRRRSSSKPLHPQAPHGGGGGNCVVDGTVSCDDSVDSATTCTGIFVTSNDPLNKPSSTSFSSFFRCRVLLLLLLSSRVLGCSFSFGGSLLVAITLSGPLVILSHGIVHAVLLFLCGRIWCCTSICGSIYDESNIYCLQYWSTYDSGTVSLQMFLRFSLVDTGKWVDPACGDFFLGR